MQPVGSDNFLIPKTSLPSFLWQTQSRTGTGLLEQLGLYALARDF